VGDAVTLQLGTLTLRNVRSYESASLTFGPGVTVLTGDVGSGKTSLLHAVEMALFGFAEVDAPYLVRHRTGEAAVSLTLSDAEHSYELSRTFRRRTRRGREVFDAEEPSFRVDGELRTYSLTEFRQRVIELLGFPDNPNPRSRSDLWRWAVYTPQERMREILYEDEADARLATIRKALGLERYHLAADNAELVATAVRTRARSHSDVAVGMQHFEADLAAADADVTASRTALALAQAAAADGRRGAAEGEELLARSEAERRRRDGDRRHLEQLRQEEGRLDTTVAVAARRAAEAERDAEAKERAAESASVSEERLAAARQRESEAEARLEEARTRAESAERCARSLATAEAATQASRRSTEELDRAVVADRGERIRAQRELDGASARGPAREPSPPTPRSVDEIAVELEVVRRDERESAERSSLRNAEVRELTELLSAGRCPRCHQDVRPEEFASHRDEAERASAAAAAQVESLRARMEALETERASRERFERVRQSWLAREDLRTAAQSALDRAVARSEERERLAQRAHEELAAATAVLDHAREDARPFERAPQDRRDAEAHRDQARHALLELERAGTAAESLRSAAAAARAQSGRESERWQEFVQQREEVRTSIATFTTTLSGATEADRLHSELVARRDEARRVELATNAARTAAEERFQFAEGRRAVADRGVAERRRHVNEAARLERTGAFVKGPFRDSLLDLERRLLARAQSTFERSFARSFSALVEDPGLLARCSPTFVPYVEIDGEMTPADALSGGERTALALAFRLALGEVVRAAGRLRLDTIVLDEPTDGFSPEQVVRMGELLRDLPWGQVLVVTHEVSLAGIADASVRVRKEGGVSRLEGTGVGSPGADPAVRKPRRRATRVDPPTPSSAT
jgi:exonuclease SbcC